MPAAAKPKKVYIGAKVPIDHANKLRDIARGMDLSVSQLFRRMVKDGIESVKRENGSNPNKLA